MANSLMISNQEMLLLLLRQATAPSNPDVFTNKSSYHQGQHDHHHGGSSWFIRSQLQHLQATAPTILPQIVPPPHIHQDRHCASRRLMHSVFSASSTPDLLDVDNTSCTPHHQRLELLRLAAGGDSDSLRLPLQDPALEQRIQDRALEQRIQDRALEQRVLEETTGRATTRDAVKDSNKEEENCSSSSRVLLPTMTASESKETLELLGTTLRETYMDVSRIVLPAGSKDKNSSNKKPPGLQRARNNGGGSPPKNFTKTLHSILRDERCSHIISFLPPGRAFCVRDNRAFAKTVMPAYFKKSKSWETFARQLSMYGFRRLNAGPDAGCYYHELFLQGRPELAEYMDRVGIPSGGRDRRRERSTRANRPDPNFYIMSPCTI